MDGTVRVNTITRVLFAAALTAPAYGITTFNDPSGYVAPPGTTITGGISLDGVAQINTGSLLCSGALLADKIHVLTAAHCMAGATAGGTTVTFNPVGGAQAVGLSSFTVNPGFDGAQVFNGFDLAVLTLSSAVTGISGYTIYSGSSEVGSTVQLAGWGESGLGSTGETTAYGTLHYGSNKYDTTAAVAPFNGSSGILMGDFDNGTVINDAFGAISPALADLGLGTLEVSIAHGDSGGPSFLNGFLVGIHSFGAAVGSPPDIDGTLNFSFGELFGDTRLSSNTVFLNSVLTPEPGSLVLAALGLAGIAFSRARARR
jgi:hypothetical protein